MLKYLKPLMNELLQLMEGIEVIDSQKASEILQSDTIGQENYRPLGKFFIQEKDKYVGIDNQNGYAWTEEFDSIIDCIKWLKGEY